MKNFGYKHYMKPTPANLRRFGDAILAASTFATAGLVMCDKPGLAIGIVLLGAMGKFLTNFFSNEK